MFYIKEIFPVRFYSKLIFIVPEMNFWICLRIFLQSDGRDGPDISKGLFNVKVEDFTNIKEKDGWIKYVKDWGNKSIYCS